MLSNGDVTQKPSMWTRDPYNKALTIGSIRVTRWLYYYSIFGHLQQWRFAQKCQICIIFCKIKMDHLKNWAKALIFLPKLRNFTKSCHAGVEIYKLFLSRIKKWAKQEILKSLNLEAYFALRLLSFTKNIFSCLPILVLTKWCHIQILA